MPNLAFSGMSFMFKFRDWLFSRAAVLREAEIQLGDCVLDYGCGPGSYVPYLAAQVGAEGKVYALDIHPMAIRRVQSLASQRGMGNVYTIQSDCSTGLPDGSVDIVLLYDILHMLSERDAVLAELCRVLKPEGVLSVEDPHIRESEIVSRVTDKGLFRLAHKGARTYSFVPAT